MANRTGTYYAAAGSVHGYGLEFKVGEGDGSPETFESVAGVRSVSFGDTDTEDIDVTHLRSPNRHREHRAGMRDSSPIAITGVYMVGEQSLTSAGGGTGPFTNGGLPTLSEDGVVRNFQVTHPDLAEAVEIRGYVKKFSLTDASQDDVINYSFEVMPAQAFVLP